MQIFVTSPLPLPMDEDIMWGESIIHYDSGARQGSTPWYRPLKKWSFTVTNMERSKQSSLYAFYNSHFGRVQPFLMKDPYDQTFTGITIARSGEQVNSGSSVRARDSRSWHIIPDSSGFSVVSALSGTLTSSTHYVLSMDNGNIYFKLTKANADRYEISGTFFRKVAFSDKSMQSFLWNEFNGQFAIEEMIP